MPVSPVASTPNTSADSGTAAAAAAKQTLDSEDFMKLLIVEMGNQDPLDPMDNTEYIAQMAQFTSLNQTQSLVSEMSYMRADIQLQAATSLIGKNVTISTDNGPITGVPTSVTADTSAVYVTIDGVSYPYGSVTKVEPVTTTAQ